MKRFFLAAVFAAMAAGGASAQDSGSHAGHDMSVTTSATTASPAAEAYMDAMDRMHGPMMEGVANADPDVAFVLGMIPHHQGAIDMATIVLEYGKDDFTRGLAQEVIAAQEKEIAGMRAWLKQRGIAEPAAHQ
ncbi:hypothetical protein LA66_18850 [Aureimonas altamirensis]|uniref:DUF305 domain-containing protein n=1 Tax=Aureimonas altamirensis TaxID=370622 RepID=A0A0B1Q3N4_9HYPH|nr:DUF305 domain-containing protein [Aureimonas altamirensis]KHJ53450.1 hypothetical protein LA66_18850 [Aureimonas altamirensis]